jgi:hypothetical protein
LRGMADGHALSPLSTGDADLVRGFMVAGNPCSFY